ncbi:hypothetical protein BN946_scf184298.g19 [Trametes cinnabarina]|uniref:Uncharacterized protein n=1 Tax=Pycnoporus cinnabarinus TaxID=5643 RepID=A0A060SR11_PYCCI|nr:hypothetical protein BN946_scf184298.g19 [Trametes cinnabarina]
MVHNPTLLGFSLLVLSCASPTLGSSSDFSSGIAGAGSAPSSPSLGFNPSFKFNPDIPVTTLSISAPQSTSSGSDMASQTASAHSDLVNPSPVPGTDILSSPDSVDTTVLDSSATTGSPDPADLVPHILVPPANDGVDNTGVAMVFNGPVNSPVDAHVTQSPVATSAPEVQAMKHSHTPSAAHRKLASKFKSVNPSISADSLAATTVSSTIAATIPTTASSFDLPSGSPASQASVASTLTVPRFSTTRMILDPTPGVLDDPNPDVQSQSASDASERARRRAILAALLILGTLGALGSGVLCFKCGILPCCPNRQRRHRKSRTSWERMAEEGLRKLPRIVSTEKSIIPGAPPVDVPILSRDSHALSCSTCPDSMNCMRSGISGHVSDWRVYATNQEGYFEDVTHILSSDAFSVRSAQDTRRASAGSWSPRHSADSTGSGNIPESSADSRSGSRASGSGASMTAESYKSCESRYSTPSFERHSRDGPLPASPTRSSSLSVRSSSSPASVSVLLRTPEQTGYAGLADAALPKVVDVAVMIPTVSESEAEDMDLDSQWDVAGTYGALVDKHPLNRESVQALPVVVERPAGTVDLGGRTCVLMHG